CESVLSEACFLLRKIQDGPLAVMQLVERGVLEIPFKLGEEHAAVARLMARYASQSISLADACLVRMAELFATSQVLTLVSDFHIYRKNGRQVIPTISPS